MSAYSDFNWHLQSGQLITVTTTMTAPSCYAIVAGGANYTTSNVVYYDMYYDGALQYAYAAGTAAQQAGGQALNANNAAGERVQWQLHAERLNAEQDARLQADRKAEALLKTMLTADQRCQYESGLRYFDVLTTKDGKTRRYRIEHGWAGNVFLMDDNGRPIERFCIHPALKVPVADNLIAQKLLLETDEEKFLSIANKTVLRAA